MGPRTTTSPASPSATSVTPSSTATSLTSVNGSARPTVPYFGRCGGLMCVGAVVSESP